MQLDVGCELIFDVTDFTPFVLMLRPRSGYGQWVSEERYTLSPLIPVVEYLDPAGHSPFEVWFRRIEARAAVKVTVALARLEAGNLSNAKSVGGGVLGQIITLLMPAVTAAAATGDLSITNIVTQVVSGGVRLNPCA